MDTRDEKPSSESGVLLLPKGNLVFDHVSKDRLVGWLVQLNITDIRTQYNLLGLVTNGIGCGRKKQSLAEHLADYLISFGDPTAQHPSLQGRLLEQVERWLAYCAVLTPSHESSFT